MSYLFLYILEIFETTVLNWFLITSFFEFVDVSVVNSERLFCSPKAGVPGIQGNILHFIITFTTNKLGV